MTPPEAPNAPATVRRRLQWLMVGRLVVVTLILGGTLLVAVEPEKGFEGFTPRALITLIAGTYAATLAFAIWLPREAQPHRVAGVQLAWDLLLTTGLVYLSGGVASVFTVLYGITILMSAIIVGTRATQITAVASILVYVVLGVAVANGWLPAPPDQDVSRYHLPAEAIGFSLMSNVVGLTVVGLLAGNLSSRLRRAGSELERAAENVANLARMNDDIVRSITAGLITTDFDGRVRTVNPAGAEMFGVAAESLIGAPVWDLLPVPRDEPRESREVEAPPRDDGTATRPDGSTFPVGYTETPLVTADGEVTGRLISFQDLTEIRELRAAAERAERLATLGRLAAGLAHEIRNPLSSISGSVELVREGELPEEDRHLLGIVIGEVERLNELVTTMLQVGRPREPSRRTCDIARLTGDVVAMAETGPAKAKRLSIDYEPAPGPVEAWADPDQLRQVVWNLLKNAVQASPPDATIRVRVQADGTATVVEVSDRGEGIDPESAGRLFDTFFSGRAQGVGLGLALVKQIVDQHGGEVSVESTPGEGATFRVSIPTLASDRPPARS